MYLSLCRALSSLLWTMVLVFVVVVIVVHGSSLTMVDNAMMVLCPAFYNYLIQFDTIVRVGSFFQLMLVLFLRWTKQPVQQSTNKDIDVLKHSLVRRVRFLSDYTLYNLYSPWYWFLSRTVGIQYSSVRQTTLALHLVV
jgi:hypothetical protein